MDIKEVCKKDQEFFFENADKLQEKLKENGMYAGGFYHKELILRLRVDDQEETDKLKSWMYCKSADGSQSGLTLFGCKLQEISWSKSYIDLGNVMTPRNFLNSLDNILTHNLKNTDLFYLFDTIYDRMFREKCENIISQIPIETVIELPNLINFRLNFNEFVKFKIQERDNCLIILNHSNEESKKLYELGTDFYNQEFLEHLVIGFFMRLLRNENLNFI